ncbi:hypothetical protein P1P75_11990 [Streptomyces sp. ID05-39B]|uniref:hypothetical protein n=1 Tax=Streptomyces sp. ID05-39B TaxID=3028664 RepID=UPI0029A8493B|nr:hypothetical protein [Streptomyces sp. ID05-39B]MDX3527144.1 hypothetical protein [Streptomyces sp. ID05-39B]
MSQQNLGPILDGLGNTLDLDEGDLVVSALVIIKVVDGQGRVSLGLSTSENLSWIDQNGLLFSAQQIVNQAEVTNGDDA